MEAEEYFTKNKDKFCIEPIDEDIDDGQYSINDRDLIWMLKDFAEKKGKPLGRLIKYLGKTIDLIMDGKAGFKRLRYTQTRLRKFNQKFRDET